MLLFDTGKRLEKAVGEEAAQIIIEAFERLSEEQKKESATKGDVRETELRLQGEIELTRKEIKEVELRLQKEIQQVKYDLLKWQLGIGLAIILVVAKGFGWLGF